MQKTISAVAVISGLIAGPGTQASNLIVIDTTQIQYPLTLISDTSQGIIGDRVLPPTISQGAVSQTPFTPFDDIDGGFILQGVYTVDYGGPDDEMHVDMALVGGQGTCLVNNAPTASIGNGRFTATAVGMNLGAPNAATCTITISEESQTENSFSVRLTQDVPGITLMGTPIEDEIGEGKQVLPGTVAAGGNYSQTFKSATVDPGTFNISGDYSINDGGTVDGGTPTIKVGMNYQGGTASTCTVGQPGTSEANFFTGKSHYNVTTSGQGGAHNSTCTISFSRIEQNENKFSISLNSNMPSGGITFDDASATYTYVSERFPSSVSPGTTGEVSFMSLDPNPSAGTFLMQGTYKINDGGPSNSLPVKMELTASGGSVCLVNGEERTEFDTGGDAGTKKWYVATVDKSKGVPNATTCSISVESVPAPPITKATITINNQVAAK